MKQPKDTQARSAYGRRPPEYVIVVAQLAGQNRSDATSLIEALEAHATPSGEHRADPEQS
jgi:hypothetical protein